MKPNQSHVAGLELALANVESLQSDSADSRALHAAFEELLKTAKAAPAEPVQGEANPVLGYADNYRQMARSGVENVGIWSVITDLERNIAPLYTASAKPDAELVELEKMRQRKIGALTVIRRLERLVQDDDDRRTVIQVAWDSVGRIDAKLAELSKDNPHED